MNIIMYIAENNKHWTTILCPKRMFWSCTYGPDREGNENRNSSYK